MKFRTILITSLALGMCASIPALRAEDEKAPAAPAPEQKADAPKAEHKGPRGGGRMDPDQMVAHLDEALSLTADQKAKIKDIYVKAREEIQATAPEERREKMMEVMKSTHDQVRAALTPEQQTKFDAMRPPRGEHKKKAE